MTSSKDIRHQIHLAGLWKKVFCLLLLSDKTTHQKTKTNKRKQEKQNIKISCIFFFFLKQLLFVGFFFRSRHHVINSFKHWLSISLQKESSKDVNVERCKRCVGSSRLGLEQIVDPVSDCVRKASHGRRQARWRRRDEVVHKRTDGEDNRVANGAPPRLNRAQAQCYCISNLIYWRRSCCFFFHSLFSFFSSGFWQGGAVWLVSLSQLSDHLKVVSWWIASHSVLRGQGASCFFFLFCMCCCHDLSLSF